MDKTMELLEKLYIEMQDMKKGMQGMEQRMATKDDLKNFATKDDLKNFATKDDLKNFATKDDLKNFVTKDDIKNLATKEDLNILAEELHHEIQIVQDQVQELTDNLDIMEMLTTKNSYEISKIKLAR